jgi:predicted acyltransferase
MADSLESTPSTRLTSLDALRGFDMCCILGLDDFLPRFLRAYFPEAAVTKLVVTQFEHVEWKGFRFYDLIFPLFVFLSGVSLAIAVPKRKARDGVSRTAGHLVLRAVLLVVIGALYYGGQEKGLDHVRWVGVLQRIGIASAAAGLLLLVFSWRGLLASLVGILAGYWLLMAFVPVPEVGAGHFDEGANLANYIDKIALPGRRWDGDHDPEGLLSTLPAIGTALLGVLAGLFLFSRVSSGKKFAGLLIAGAVLIAGGWSWHPYFPVIKKLWTSSYVLVAGGWSLVLLAMFYGVIDGLGFRRWARPFVWVGENPIALYLVSGLGIFSTVAVRIVCQQPESREWFTALVAFLLMLGMAYWLDRKRLLIRI